MYVFINVRIVKMLVDYLIHWMPSCVLTLKLDFAAQDQVSSQSEDQEENPQHYEVHVELCILHIQQLQDLLRLLELTSIVWTIQLSPVHPVDGEYHPLKAVPEREHYVNPCSGFQIREDSPK